MVHREVARSSSRSTSGASSSMDCIKAARSTDGVFPAAAAKKNIRAMPTAADSRRLRPSRAVRKPERKETWRPDTATTWAVPVRRRAE